MTPDPAVLSHKKTVLGFILDRFTSGGACVVIVCVHVCDLSVEKQMQENPFGGRPVP